MSQPKHIQNPVTPFAVTNYRDIRKIFGIKEKNRRGHMYILGQTGTGKSTLVQNMAVSDIRQREGLALVDPHGDLAEGLLHFVPKERIQDVVYFNPADLARPVAFNPLERVEPEERHLVASGLISVLKKIWPDFWGPRLEHLLRHSLLTLLEIPGSTLLDVPRLLTDQGFRKGVLARISDRELKEFWQMEFEKYSAWLRSDAVSPILNKIGQFLAARPLRNIVGQKENTFDLREVMDQGKILVVNLSKGKIGEDNSALLGAMVLTKVQLAALGRSDMPEEKRRPFYLYADEFHNFLTLSFADILSEARKYGLNLILAHQYIEQLDDKIRAAVFGNAGTVVCFRVGTRDARHLAQEFYPVFEMEDLLNLPNYHIYLKLMIDGRTSLPFSAVTLPPPERHRSSKEEVVRLSRETYGRPQAEVERDLRSRPWWTPGPPTPCSGRRSPITWKSPWRRERNCTFRG